MGMASSRTRKRPESGDTADAQRARTYRRLVGRRLSMLRKRRDISAEEAAAQLGCSQSVISKWETGKTLPGAEWLLAISRVYGVSVDWLIRPEGDNFAALVLGDQVSALARVAAGQPNHPLWNTAFALPLSDNMLPLHGAATVQAFKESMRRLKERGKPDDVADALAWVAVLDS